ncbi:MAG: hypothetical protein EPN93_21180 [Spirochaetes bacterium]|nr:MAG: hypothetical protein EPN93_21180 [Spirochaetota bacterium]
MKRRMMFLIMCLVPVLFFSSCVSLFLGPNISRFPVEKDSSRQSDKYGKAEVYAGILNQYGFDEFKRYGRRMLVENSDLKEEEKIKIADSLDKMQYEESRYLYFSILYNMPFLFSELKMKFMLVDGKGNNLYDGNVFVPIKQTIYGSYETQVHYNYTFFVKSSKALNQAIKESDVRLHATFPDGSETIFRIQL